MNKFFDANKDELKEGLEIEVKISNYKYNKDGSGFQANIFIEAEYKEKVPPSVEGALFDFAIAEEPRLPNLSKVGDSQTIAISLKPKNEPLGMLVAVVSTPSCMEVNMNELEILKERELVDNFEMSADKSAVYLYWTSLTEARELSFTRVK